MRHSLLLPFAALALAGCGHAYAYGSDNRDLPAFDKLQTSRGVSVTLSCGSANKAVLQGDSREVSEIETTVEGGTLIVRRASNWDSGDRRPVHINVTTTQALGQIHSSSGSSVDAPACAVSSDHLDIEASSGGTIHLAGNPHRLVAEASSGGTISRLDGARLDASEAELRASSGGTVRVCAVGRLDGKASSGGSISSESSEKGDRNSSSGGEFSTRRCS